MIHDVLRYYNLTVAVFTVISGTWQMRRWFSFGPPERLVWMGAALANAAIIVGTIESLVGDEPAGFTVFVVTVTATWLFVATVYRPYCRWRRRRDCARE